MPRLTSKGQVTVPVGIRYALGLAPGDDVVFSVEAGRGVFRRVTSVADLAARFAGDPRPGAHALERLLVGGDAAFARELAAHRDAGTRLRLPDAVLLDIAASLLRAGASAAAVAAAMRDALSERALRVDHPSALRAAIDVLAEGGDAVRAYALARG